MSIAAVHNKAAPTTAIRLLIIAITPSPLLTVGAIAKPAGPKNKRSSQTRRSKLDPIEKPRLKPRFYRETIIAL